MEHVFKKGAPDAPTFILLHGTGGDENDLIPLAQNLNPSYNILGVRGEISENGMNRFFKRHGQGKYDIEDLNFRTDRLIQFLKDAAEQYEFDLEKAVVVGFSNGSNIALNRIFDERIDFQKALLYAPLYPLPVTNEIDLSHMDILISAGERDPISPVRESKRLISLLKQHGANVETVWVNSHELSREGIEAGQKLLAQK
ncbi:alpha/beta hydrolase [Staphylococcus auricularis]|uniref:alpha/beta hydrolase n=1 Tax=Staphylococcus auricularis TaxID=29379 RepID=UPI003F7933A7